MKLPSNAVCAILPAALILFLTPALPLRACSAGWSLTVADALRDAASTNRLAMVAFTGSDWSAGSLRLDETVLMNPSFSDMAMSSFALAQADFPQRRKPDAQALAANTDIATRHGIRHFPTLLALRPDGTEFARLEYKEQTVEEVSAALKQWRERFALEAGPVKTRVEP